MVKVYLSSKGVPFTERNVSLEEDARDALLGLGFRVTPLTVIGEHRIVGYSTAKIDEALEAVAAQ